MAQDKAYRRDLKRALEKLVKVKRITVRKDSHLEVVVVLPDGSESVFTSSGSPRDHHFSINQTVASVKKRIRGTYE